MDGEHHMFTRAEPVEETQANEHSIFFKTQLGDIYLIPLVNVRRVVFSEDEEDEEE
jgi:hypothetical protein